MGEIIAQKGGFTRNNVIELMESYAKEHAKSIIQLLEIAKCPDCDGSGTVVTSVHPDDGSIDGIEPCRWCYERNKLIAE